MEPGEETVSSPENENTDGIPDYTEDLMTAIANEEANRGCEAAGAARGGYGRGSGSGGHGGKACGGKARGAYGGKAYGGKHRPRQARQGPCDCRHLGAQLHLGL